MGTIKIGDFEMVVRDKDGKELDTVPDDLPIVDFEGNQLTVKELKEGYLRQQDYTKKTQEVAELRKFLQDQLGLQDTKQGVRVIENMLSKLAELEQVGVIDPQTGEIRRDVLGKGAGTSSFSSDDDDDDLGGYPSKLDLQSLPPEVVSAVEQTKALSRDMGMLLRYIADQQISSKFQDFTERDREWVFKMAAQDPTRTPLEWAEELHSAKKEWGQKAIDEYVKQQEEEKKGHARPGTGDKEGLELFGEDVAFSFRPGEEQDGKKVLDPRQAAEAYLKAALEEA